MLGKFVAYDARLVRDRICWYRSILRRERKVVDTRATTYARSNPEDSRELCRPEKPQYGFRDSRSRADYHTAKTPIP
jgi:hypothetical protein